MTSSKFCDSIIEHANSSPEKEVCGFVILSDDLIAYSEEAINENPKPADSFSISPAKFLNYKLNKNILGIYHSHTRENELPSEHDKAGAEATGLPYLIYSLKTERFFLYYPESYDPANLLGRPYVKGFYECTCILKDYFISNLDNNITTWNENYWLPESDETANKLLINILNKNLIQLKKQDNIQKHDVIVFELKQGKRFHVGIYLGNDYFVHQPMHGLSCNQLFDERWQSKVKHVYRHHSLV